MSNDSKLRKIYDIFISKWILSAFIILFSSYWLAILPFIGVKFGITDASGKLTLLGHSITWPLIILCTLFTLLKTYADKRNNDHKNNGQIILDELLDHINQSTRKKIQRFADFIKYAEHHNNIPSFPFITQPRRQLDNILDNLQISLSSIFGIKRDNIGLSLIYQLNNKWEWLVTMNIAHDLKIEDLLTNTHTTFYQLINSDAQSIFYPDKKIGIKENRYVAGPIDKSHRNIGSVLCRKICVPGSGIPLNAVLSLTTYGMRLCNPDDADAIDKVENLVISNFEPRLQMELALLYIKEVMSSNCRACCEKKYPNSEDKLPDTFEPNHQFY